MVAKTVPQTVLTLEEPETETNTLQSLFFRYFFFYFLTQGQGLDEF